MIPDLIEMYLITPGKSNTCKATKLLLDSLFNRFVLKKIGEGGCNKKYNIYMLFLKTCAVSQKI